MKRIIPTMNKINADVLFDQLERSIRQIEQAAHGITDCVNSVRTRIHAGQKLNTLGELQHLVSAYEAAVGAYTAIDNVIDSLE